MILEFDIRYICYSLMKQQILLAFISEKYLLFIIKNKFATFDTEGVCAVRKNSFHLHFSDFCVKLVLNIS